MGKDETLATIWEVPDHLWEQIHPVILSSKTKPQRQPGSQGADVWRPTRCTAPTAPWMRSFLRREEIPSGSAQGDHCHGPQALARIGSIPALRYGHQYAECRRGILRETVSAAEALRTAKLPGGVDWEYQLGARAPMVSTRIPACLSTRRRPRIWTKPC